MSRRFPRVIPTEDQIALAVFHHWRTLGLPDTLVASIPNKKAFGQPGLTPGLPDLLVMAPGLKVGFLELKRTLTSPVSPAQFEFHQLCERLGVPRAIAVGRDEPVDVLKAWGAIR